MTWYRVLVLCMCYFLIEAMTFDIHAKLHFDAVVITNQHKESFPICCYLAFCPVPETEATQLETFSYEQHLSSGHMTAIGFCPCVSSFRISLSWENNLKTCMLSPLRFMLLSWLESGQVHTVNYIRAKQCHSCCIWMPLRAMYILLSVYYLKAASNQWDCKLTCIKFKYCLWSFEGQSWK